MTNFQTPHFRYSNFSNFLTGVTLIPRETPPQDAVTHFYELDDTLFLGFADDQTLIALLNDTGLIPAWQAQGNEKIWLTTERPSPNCHILSVFTELDAQSELLLYAILWLEYTRIDALHAAFPSVCVEHLRLQNPRAKFQDHAPLPGQDFPPSGLFRRAFSLACIHALKTGAALITEVPEYFHTSWLFSPYFTYVDPEMAAIYQNIKNDLLPPKPTFSDAAALSRAFEEGRILCDASPYYWPTELQAHAFSSNIRFDTHPVTSSKHFTCS